MISMTLPHFVLDYISIMITAAAVRIPNRTKYNSWRTSFSGESNRGSQSDCSLRQPTITKVECL